MAFQIRQDTRHTFKQSPGVPRGKCHHPGRSADTIAGNHGDSKVQRFPHRIGISIRHRRSQEKVAPLQQGPKLGVTMMDNQTIRQPELPDPRGESTAQFGIGVKHIVSYQQNLTK